MRFTTTTGLVALTLAATPAFAAGNHFGLTISTGATQNVQFSGGVFTATADNAVLNVNDLENALASGSVTVTTGNGSGGTRKGDLHVETALSWTSANGLTLDAYHTIFVDRPVSVAGPGALTLTTNDGGKGGDLNFGQEGKVTFLSTANSLIVNAQAYTLVNSVATLAGAIASNTGGYYALGADYDASADGTYTYAPVPGGFRGEVEGLGNAIANLTVAHTGRATYVGLFSTISARGGKHPFPGTVRDLTLSNVNIHATGSAYVGGLAGSASILIHDRVTGTVVGGTGVIGGLAGTAGRVEDCSSNVAVVGAKHAIAGGLLGSFPSSNHLLQASSSTGSVKVGKLSAAGGLVGESDGSIETSFSAVSVSAGDYSNAGGLVGFNNGGMQNTFATGSVSSGKFGNAGGMIGSNIVDKGDATVILSYGSGLVSGGTGSFTGGFVGEDKSQGSIRATYWDTTSSSQSQGAGNVDEGGMTGLTTQELQAALPEGFSKKIWAQDPGINNGLPYLIVNPPLN